MSAPKPIIIEGGGITGPVTYSNHYLDLSGKRDLTFIDMHMEDTGQVFAKKPCQNIRFIGCSFKRLHLNAYGFINLSYGHDDIYFEDCHFEKGSLGIRLKYDRVTRNAAMRLTVINCTFEDIGLGPWINKDGECISRQGGHGHNGQGDVIVGNRMRNFGSGISYWGFSDRMMSDMRIEDNDIAGGHVEEITEGGGIIISGSNQVDKGLPAIGWRRNIRIRNNKVEDCPIGISANIREPIEGIETNEVKNCLIPYRIRNPFAEA